LKLLYFLVDLKVKYQEFEVKVLRLELELDVKVSILWNLIIFYLFFIRPTDYLNLFTEVDTAHIDILDQHGLFGQVVDRHHKIKVDLFDQTNRYYVVVKKLVV